MKKVQDLQTELVQTIKHVDGLTAKSSDLDHETAQLKKRIGEQQKYRQELEEREVKLQGEYIQMLEKQGSGAQ